MFCKLDFKIGCGIYAWLIRSFQLINLPNIFMGSNKRLLRPSIGKFLLVYYNQMYCKGFNMHVKLIGCVLHDDILICCKKSTQHDRRLVYYDGDLRHESLYFNPKVLECFGSSLSLPDKYLRYLNRNLQNYVRKIGLTELGTNLISSTITISHYDMVFGFNPLTLFNSFNCRCKW